MSAGEFQTVLISAPTTPVTSSIHLESSLPDPDKIPSTEDPSTRLDSQMLLKRENSPDIGISSPGFIVEQTSSQTALQTIDADYNSNSFNFSYDGSFSLSPQQNVDIKDLEKADSTTVILSNPPLSNSSNASPKSFMALGINETKSDKMISGFDGRMDGLSPLSVIAVSAYQDVGHPSPNMPSSVLSRTHVLRFHAGSGDTMLSALNYNDNDILQEGGFDVSAGHSFGSLDGLLGATGAGGMRLPDLLDGEMNHETYMDTDQDLQLSPQAFNNGSSAFGVRESSPLPVLGETHIKNEIKKTNESAATTLIVEKLKVKNPRPVKATSPNRPNTQPCPTCGKVFSNSSALTKHKLTHSDERKYVCQLCAKAFKRQDHLNGHMLTHRNKKPYECDAEGCGKSYCDARSLRRHKENHHSNTSSATTLNSQVSVIPGLAHLGFNSLQTSFPASVITSTSGPAYSEATSLANRIQYAPPPTTSLSNHTSENVSRTVNSSAIPATQRLQFLTFQQQQTSSKASPSPPPKNVPLSESGTTSWQPQTINTGALLLAQNFGASSRTMGQAQASQLITRSFETSSTTDQGNSSSPELSQLQLLGVKQESESSADLLTTRNIDEQNVLEHAVFSEACFEVVNSSTGAKQLVKLTPQGSMNLQFESSSGTVVRLREARMDPMFPRSSMQIVKIETSDTDNSTSSKENINATQVESPLLQQLLNQQQNGESSTIPLSRSDHAFLTTLTEQSKQTLSQQSSVLMSTLTQVPFSRANSVQSTPRVNQDPKPVECSLCQRKFKNIPALNGHMRLHGGYFKKENDAKKNEKKNTSHPPLQTASTNVRALIEEKINQKRNGLSQASIPTTTTFESSQPPVQTLDFQTNQLPNHQPNSHFIAEASPIISPMNSETSVFDSFPNPSQSPDLDSYSHDLSFQHCDIFKKFDLKTQFRIPHPPMEKLRRHSDSDHFILPKRPCTSFTNSALADLLRNRVVAKRTCRTGSDPGESLNLDTAFSSISDTFSDLPKFSSLMASSLDDSATDLHPHDLTAITPGDAALPVLSAEDIPEAQPMMMNIRDLPDLDTQCLERNVFFDNSNNDLSQAFPEISVSDFEMMQFSSVVTSTANLPTEVKPVNGGKVRIGEDSNDDDVFLSPTSLPTSPMKHKKKRRPEPIYIPPYVNTSNFHSRLRSPRRFDQKNHDQKNLSPPPYTPPPMLSPVRSGSGLFWHILSGSGSLTPKSAPIIPSFNLGRKASISDSASEAEDEFFEAPESDTVPHVNIGSHYQAKIPPFNPNFKDALLVNHKADKVWDPCAMSGLTEEEVESFLELSCCALVPGGGRNKEYALHLLQNCQGNIQEAILSLMDLKPQLSPHHPLLSFQYSENDQWSPSEIEAYHQGLLRCDKDFFSISKEIPTKTVKQCIQFYYLWKKVCPDEYKRIRLIRRRKEQESLIYNLRSKDEEQEDEDKSVKQTFSPTAINSCKTNSSDKKVTLNGSGVPPRTKESKSGQGKSNATYNGTGISSTYDFTMEPLEEFPCKICGKVFNKVKSRSAHMKTHRQTDNDKKNHYEC